jgi:hypothetical protein
MSVELPRILYRWMAKHEFDLVFPKARGVKQTQRNALRDSKRHTMAVNYIRKGGDLFRPAHLGPRDAGHDARRYANFQIEDLETAHARLSLSTASR